MRQTSSAKILSSRHMKPEPKSIAIEVQDVTKSFVSSDEVVVALKGIDFSVRKGEFVSLVGPSGCGKSTCLGLIAGVMKPSSGTIRVDGEVVTKPNQHVGYMLQKDLLMPWRTILENVVFGLELRDVPAKEARSIGLSYLERYGLKGFGQHYPRQLSGGMRQRAALIRTLVLSPDIVLFDEPFSALDFQTRLTLEEEMHRILKKENKTALLITHDIAEAIAMSDRVLVVTKRPGRIKASHRIELTSSGRSPLEVRQSPEFGDYFTTIWKELEIDVDLCSTDQ